MSAFTLFPGLSGLRHAMLAGCLASLMAVPATGALAQTRSTPQQGNSMTASPRVLLQTSQGNIVLELDAEKAPVTVENFLAYVRDGFFDGTIFHRVIDNFMIQGGGFDAAMKQKPTRDAIENEANNGLKNDTYTIAMARTNDPHSATAQFFINVSDNAFLNHTAPTANGWGYAVFGKVVEGMETVDKIKTVKTGNRGFHQDVPVDNIVIEQASLLD